MKDIKIDEAMSYIRKKLDDAELKLIEKIREGDEKGVLRWRAKIEVYQNIITDIINTYSQNSQEELIHHIEMLEKERLILQDNYKDICKLLKDAQEEIKKLTDRLCNVYRQL